MFIAGDGGLLICSQRRGGRLQLDEVVVRAIGGEHGAGVLEVLQLGAEPLSAHCMP